MATTVFTAGILARVLCGFLLTLHLVAFWPPSPPRRSPRPPASPSWRLRPPLSSITVRNILPPPIAELRHAPSLHRKYPGVRPSARPPPPSRSSPPRLLATGSQPHEPGNGPSWPSIPPALSSGPAPRSLWVCLEGPHPSRRPPNGARLRG